MIMAATSGMDIRRIFMARPPRGRGHTVRVVSGPAGRRPVEHRPRGLQHPGELERPQAAPGVDRADQLHADHVGPAGVKQQTIPGRNIRSVLRMERTWIGARQWRAILNAPWLKRPTCRRGCGCPSGKTNRFPPPARKASIASTRSNHQPGEPPFRRGRDVAGPAQHGAEHRDVEQPALDQRVVAVEQRDHQDRVQVGHVVADEDRRTDGLDLRVDLPAVPGHQRPQRAQRSRGRTGC